MELLQGTLDLIVLRALATMGPQHAYGLAARLEQIADHPFPLNQGTLYVALVRLEQKGWIKGALAAHGVQPRGQVLRHHQGRHFERSASRPSDGGDSPAWSTNCSSTSHCDVGSQTIILRLWNFFRPDRAERQLAREMDAHAALLQEQLQRRGLTHDEAVLATRRRLANVERTKELHRDARSFPWLEDARRDLRYATRTLARTPGFTCLALLTLALGIGSVTVIYSVIHNVLLDPLPYPGSERFVNVQIEDVATGRTRGVMSVSELLDYRDQSRVFEEVVGTRGQGVLLSTPGRADYVRAVWVTPNFFRFMGLSPLLGRAIGAGDGKPGAPPVAVLDIEPGSPSLAAIPTFSGASVLLNGEMRTIVGVMPPRFTWHAADVWIPRALQGTDPGTFLNFQARLRPGATIEEAEAQLGTIAARRAREHPQDYPPTFRVRVVSVIDAVVGNFRAVLYSLLAAVALLMLIACCNVANMLLARATVREREMTVRASLGAGQGRIVRQSLVESLLLSLVGGALGCLLCVRRPRSARSAAAPGPAPGRNRDCAGWPGADVQPGDRCAVGAPLRHRACGGQRASGSRGWPEERRQERVRRTEPLEERAGGRRDRALPDSAAVCGPAHAQLPVARARGPGV